MNPMTAPPASQAGTFHVDAPLDRVFPLFTALGERAWAPGWEPEMLSGAEARGSAFRTRDHDGRETLWIVCDYRPDVGRVAYARLAQGSNIGLVDVACTATPSGTDVTVRYTLTPLSVEERAFVEAFVDPLRYSRMMEEWRTAVGAALRAAP